MIYGFIAQNHPLCSRGRRRGIIYHLYCGAVEEAPRHEAASASPAAAQLCFGPAREAENPEEKALDAVSHALKFT